MGRDVQAPPFAPHCREYFDSLEEILHAAGGKILLSTKAQRLITDETGAVSGVRGHGPDGPIVVDSPTVVLACGGFQNNPELRVRYLGPDADLASILGCPYQTGDGMVLAQAAGAALGGSMSTFSAVWTSAFPAVNPAEDPKHYEQLPHTLEGRVGLSDYTQTFEPLGSILVNLDGKRFVDESLRSYRVSQATIKQRRAMGVWVGDQKMWGRWLDEPTIFTGKTPREQFALMAETGGVLVQADSIESLADQLAGLEANRVHRSNLLRTITDYNKAVAAGQGTTLEVPRAPGRNVLGAGIPAMPLDEPPFYAWPVRPAIYMCYGGVRINEHAQALDSQGEPVRGLYAVPPTAGGVYREVYVGSISCAGAFGWLAGRHAVAAMSVT
jgi:succinate dehydrogenase/fumarate reductase flavoprotein subunit